MPAKRAQHFERQAHHVGHALFVVMRAAAEHGNTHAFQITDHQLGVVARHARMGKPRQIVIRDRHAVHSLCDMAKAGAEDQAKPHRRIARQCLDLRGKGFSVL